MGYDRAARFDDALWLVELNGLLEGVPGFEAARWLSHDQRHLLITVLPAGPAKAAVARLRASQAGAHLRRWAAEEPLTLFLAAVGGGVEPTPELLVKDGELWFFSGFDQPRSVPGEAFLSWFQRQFGQPFPLPGVAPELRQVGPNTWATEGVGAEQLVGLPHFLEAKGATPHRVVAFAGYGINSWACYFTSVRPGVRVRLRMPYGGVYGDPDRDGRRLVEELAAVEALIHELLEPRAGWEHVQISDNMGQRGAMLRLDGIEHTVELRGAFEEALQQLREAAFKLSAARPRSPPTASG